MLIVTKLDRFARNTREALEIIQHLFQNDIKVHILNMGISDNTPTGQLIFTIFSAFAFELKKQGITYKMIEGKTGVSIAIQKRRFKKYKNNIHFN